MGSASGLRARVVLPTRWELWELGIQLALLPLMIAPERVRQAGCRLMARLLLRRGSGYRKYMLARFPAPLRLPGKDGRMEALVRSESGMLSQRVLVMRGVLFPRWKDRVELLGTGNLRDALAAGHGAILWVHPCVASSLAVKQALHEAGFPLAHLTRPAHGFSPHPFGVRFVNPVLRRAENRFVKERVVIDDAETVRPLRRIHALLAENRVVSITITSAASRLREYPMLDGFVTLPEGPVKIAAKSGAALLPVFTHRSGSVPVVEIGPPLPARGSDAASTRACHEAAMRWLQEQVEQHPGDWVGWRADLFRRETPPA